MNKFSVTFVPAINLWIVVNAANSVVFSTADEVTARDWVIATQYETDMEIFNEFG